MTKIILPVVFLLAIKAAVAQNIGIGTTTPNVSAQLDITSTSRGLLIPRLTFNQRLNIVSPATGLLIYQTDVTPGFYYYNGASWIIFSTGSATNYWSISGSDIFNNNTGVVSVGTPVAGYDLSINKPTPSIGIRDAAKNAFSGTISGDSANLLINAYQPTLTGTPGNLILQTPIGLTLSGNVGIGEPDPTAKLHVGSGNVMIGAGSPAVKVHVRGTSGELLRLEATDPQLGLANAGVLKGVFRLGGDDIVIGSPASNTAGRLVVRLNGGDRMMVHPDGKVSIGTAVPASGYLLSVKGKIISEEVRVELNAAWPDYVFENNYNLLPLNKLQDYILREKHLPNIPSAQEVRGTGFDLGDMNRRLLEKIEELSLYIIEQDKRINVLQKQVEAIRSVK